MAANGYQSQIAAINYSYEENSTTKIGFKKNTNIYALIEENLSPAIKAQNSRTALTRLGIQAKPATQFQLSNYTPTGNEVFQMIIGETGFYEINDVRIVGLKILDAADDVIIDYIIQEI